MKKKILIGIMIIIILIILVSGFFIYKNSLKISGDNYRNKQPLESTINGNTVVQQNNNQQNNTDTEKNIIQDNTWKIFKDDYGFQMKYPSDPSVMNIPTSRIIQCDGSCPSVLKVNGIDSVMANTTINGVDYCIYSGGKSGPSDNYNEFLYVTVKNGKCYGLDFSYKTINCNSYSTDEMVQSCESQKSKNGQLISQSVSTITFTNP